jgi:D-alanyl-D-alanine dipeptidase
MTVKSVNPGYSGPALESRLVDVREFAPGICIDLIYATTDNFMGEILYPRDLCLMQEDTLEKLLKAQAIFQEDGYSIKIYDAYRPYAVTVKMAAFTGGGIFVADPKKGSNHNRGAAVDMTVVDAQGNELEMSSEVDTLDSTAFRNGPMSAAARRNLDYVESVMKSCGFVPNRYEWWHYNDSRYAIYPILDLALDEVEMVPAESVPSISPPPVLDSSKTGYVSVSPTPTPSA